jgi:hypothetical protein
MFQAKNMHMIRRFMGTESQGTRLDVALALAEQIGDFIRCRRDLFLSPGFAVRIETNTLGFSH